MDSACRFMLRAAMNTCPCGYQGDTRRSCKCRAAEIANYRKKISGPLLDRFDILIEVPPVDPAQLLNAPDGANSASSRARVVAARERQLARYAGLGLTCNAQLSGKQLREYCPLSEAQQAMLLQAVEQLGLSARAFDRILRVARTIADLAGRETPNESDLFEAIQSRSFETVWRG